ncbi:TetR/AcrR family transcriptional regulator [Pseudonocardia sp. GCM10023141]|uniref:TetR/AcrR family transcriptional regulator n=1 Tax=Pseudonocardia sp. GCM10023141 TaxID=3252653 RepID=UPI00361AB71C
MTATTARRRRPEQVRAALLEEAARSFAAKGFGGSRTAEIAASAGASESTLFAHFPTKADLFAAATLEPFVAFATGMERLTAARRDVVDRDLVDRDEDVVLRYIRDLYDHVVANRDAIRTLLALSHDPDSDVLVAAAQQRFHGLLADLTGVAREWADATGRDIPRLDLRVRTAFAMIVAIALYGSWFVPADTGFGRDTIIRELAGVVLRGAVTTERAPELPG